MLEDAPALETSEVELDRQLLDAKITVLRLSRRGAVSRAALNNAARSSGSRIVAVTAPAGYGKSTLILKLIVSVPTFGC